MKKLFVFTDGGAIGNPGPAAVGVVVRNESGKVLTSFGKFIGKTTNNVAEYQGVIEALKWIAGNVEMRKKEVRSGSRNEGEKWGKKQINSSPPPPISKLTSHFPPPSSLHFYLDSRLVVNQLNGLFKIKDAKLRRLVVKVRQLEQEVGGNISYHLIPREKNFLADQEVKKILAKKSWRQT